MWKRATSQAGAAALTISLCVCDGMKADEVMSVKCDDSPMDVDVDFVLKRKKEADGVVGEIPIVLVVITEEKVRNQHGDKVLTLVRPLR